MKVKIHIYIFMRNTKKMLKRKLYGNHLKGDFYIYLADYMKKLLKNELLIESPVTNTPFIFDAFFNRLNDSIPESIPLNRKISVLREYWHEIKDELPKEIVDENDKTILIGFIRLPQNKKPREQTLRKLYLYADGDGQDIYELICSLERQNMTVSWTNDSKKTSRNVRSILNDMSKQ